MITTAFFSTMTSYLDKYLLLKGIKKHDYFYYMCLSVVPFALIVLLITYFTVGLHFKISLFTIVLLILSMIIRYFKLHANAGLIKELEPFEHVCYSTLGIAIAYIIDIIIGSKQIVVIHIIAIIFTLIGTFMLGKVKIRVNNLQKDLIIKVMSELTLGYIAYYLLQEWSNIIYILLSNVILTIIFSKDYNIKYHINQKNIIKWCFVQQIFGFSYLFLNNYLASISVTMSCFVRPITIVFVFFIAFLFKKTLHKPDTKAFIAIIFILLGIILINA